MPQVVSQRGIHISVQLDAAGHALVQHCGVVCGKRTEAESHQDEAVTTDRFVYHVHRQADVSLHPLRCWKVPTGNHAFKNGE